MDSGVVIIVASNFSVVQGVYYHYSIVTSPHMHVFVGRVETLRANAKDSNGNLTCDSSRAN